MSEDRPQYQAERDKVPTNAEIAERLRKMSVQMLSLGIDMEYAGGFGPLAEKGQMMAEQAEIALSWAHEIESEAK